MFSIIIPYYKKRQYIERCLDSILNQTYIDYEIILVDDGSGDDIAILINTQYKDKVQLIQQENQGVSAARNTGIANAVHQYIAFLDADDSWNNQYLEFVVNVIKHNKNVKIVGTHYSKNKEILDNKYSYLNYRVINNYFKNAIINTLFFTSATVIVRSFFQKNSGFNNQLTMGEDLDVWFRVMLSEGEAYYISNTLVYYSDEDDNQATRKIGELNKALVGNVTDLYKNILKIQKRDDFEKFIKQYVFFNLYPYFFNADTHYNANEIIKKYRKKNFIMYLPYHLPQFVGSKGFVQNIIRKYYKLLFRQC